MQMWVISLMDRPDRRAAFQARAAAAGMNIDVLLVPRATKRREGWGGSAESCGCAESHLHLLDNNTGPIAIFEDDAVITPELPGLIDDAFAQMPPDWELLMLGSGYALAESLHQPEGLVRLARFALTHAYIVSERGREPLADCARHANSHWDHRASRRMCGRGKVHGYLPSVVDQDPALSSDIPDSSVLWRPKG